MCQTTCHHRAKGSAVPQGRWLQWCLPIPPFLNKPPGDAGLKWGWDQAGGCLFLAQVPPALHSGSDRAVPRHSRTHRGLGCEPHHVPSRSIPAELLGQQPLLPRCHPHPWQMQGLKQ